MALTRAYEEVLDFIASGSSPQKVANFRASEESRARVAELLHREKTLGLTPEEAAELDTAQQLEHLMRLAKARARARLGQQ